MESGFFFATMWSAFAAFIVTVAMIRICIKIAEWRGVRVWSEAPTPDTFARGLSEEQRQKIDKVRTSAILKHLNNFTMTLNEDDMTAITSTTTEEESTECCIVVENPVDEKDDALQVDLEKGKEKDETTQYSHICVPLPGQLCDNSSASTNHDDDDGDKTNETNNLKREVPNLCIICHDTYETNDKVCWASSSDCTHVFHEECIVRWLTSLGWMKLKEQKEPESLIEEEKCLNYDLECPMCRGTFICKELLTSMKKKSPVVVTDVVEERV